MEIYDIGARRLGTLIDEGDFEGAYGIVIGMDAAQREERLIGIANTAEDTQILEFLQYMLMQEESYENHRLMCQAFCQMPWVDGAYYLAYFHAEEMYRLRPGLDTGLGMLFFNEVPEKPMSDDVAYAVAKKLQREYPDSPELAEIMKRLGGRYYELPEDE